MSSHIVRTEGLVLRNLRYGDTSRVATLFTSELGKIAVIGKGVRTPGSPFGASLELFARSEFVLYFRSGRDLQMLKSGDVITVHGRLLQAPFRLAYGAAVLEFLDRVLLEEEPAPGLFSLSLRVLARLEVERRVRAGEIFRAFQLRAASLLGYALLLDACLHCGRILEDGVEGGGEDEVWLFRAPEGGALCPDCARSADLGHPLTVRALLRIRSMVRTEFRPVVAGTKIGSGEVPVAIATPRLRRDQPTPGPTGERPGAHLVVEADSSGAPASASAAELRWVAALDRIVEDFLRFHVERYRGLRSLQGGLLGSVPRP